MTNDTDSIVPAANDSNLNSVITHQSAQKVLHAWHLFHRRTPGNTQTHTVSFQNDKKTPLASPAFDQLNPLGVLGKWFSLLTAKMRGGKREPSEPFCSMFARCTICESSAFRSIRILRSQRLDIRCTSSVYSDGICCKWAGLHEL